ncbi:hypothetical protein V8C44DRAFT_258437 [Trichoderma aethiopicum]
MTLIVKFSYHKFTLIYTCPHTTTTQTNLNPRQTSHKPPRKKTPPTPGHHHSCIALHSPPPAPPIFPLSLSPVGQNTRSEQKRDNGSQRHSLFFSFPPIHVTRVRPPSSFIRSLLQRHTTTTSPFFFLFSSEALVAVQPDQSLPLLSLSVPFSFFSILFSSVPRPAGLYPFVQDESSISRILPEYKVPIYVYHQVKIIVFLASPHLTLPHLLQLATPSMTTSCFILPPVTQR